MAQGWDVVYAYGNAESDIEAFKEVGIPNDHIYLVGELADDLEVEPIPDEEAFSLQGFHFSNSSLHIRGCLMPCA